MSSDVVGPPSILRYATVTALVTAILTAGVTYTVTKTTTTTAVRSQYVQKIGSSSGTYVAIDGYANLTASGHIVAADGLTGSGKLSVGGSDGGKICLMEADGGEYSVITATGGVLATRAAAAGECP